MNLERSDSTDAPAAESVGTQAPRLAIMGDSVIAGLGARGRAYAVMIAERLGVDGPLNLARSTHTVVQCLEQLPEICEYNPNIVLIGIGGADGLVHTSHTSQRILDRIAPKSWQGVEGLEPRAYYSTDRKKRIRQKVTSTIKVSIKKTILLFSKGYQRVPIAEFDRHIANLFSVLEEMGCVVIVCGVVESDPKYFPRTPPAMQPYRDSLKREAGKHAKFRYVDIREVIVRWDDYLDDHTHLTAETHDKIADLIGEQAGDLLHAVNLA